MMEAKQHPAGCEMKRSMACFSRDTSGNELHWKGEKNVIRDEWFCLFWVLTDMNEPASAVLESSLCTINQLSKSRERFPLQAVPLLPWDTKPNLLLIPPPLTVPHLSPAGQHLHLLRVPHGCHLRAQHHHRQPAAGDVQAGGPGEPGVHHWWPADHAQHVHGAQQSASPEARRQGPAWVSPYLLSSVWNWLEVSK